MHNDQQGWQLCAFFEFHFVDSLLAKKYKSLSRQTHRNVLLGQFIYMMARGWLEGLTAAGRAEKELAEGDVAQELVGWRERRTFSRLDISISTINCVKILLLL